MDVVYTYVNSNDDSWKLRRLAAKFVHYSEDINNFDSNSSARYQDNEELRFSMRSVRKHAPWVRNIYIVTDQQVPQWLSQTENVKIVDHKEIIPTEFLPTFNSHVIELYLHKIKGVSSPFLYLNDDVMFIQDVKMSDFVDSDNKFAVFLDSGFSKKGTPIPMEYGFRSAWKNSNKWLDSHFTEEPRRKMAHAPMVIHPDIVDELWTIMKPQLTKTSQHRFRSIYDFNLLCSVYIYFGLYTNRAFESDLKSLQIFDGDDPVQKLELVDEPTTDFTFFCPNTFSQEVAKFLQEKFPQKEDFEEQSDSDSS